MRTTTTGHDPGHTRPAVSLCHDYLTQRGGAERVVLTLASAFPGAAVHTSLYDPVETYPEFAAVDVRTAPLDRLRFVRQNHRWSLPAMAWAFGNMRVDADVTVCSSSGWAHGVQAGGRKLVYCHSPARWLYRTENYLEHFGRLPRTALRLARRRLVRWDQAAMRSADRIVVNSNTIADEVRSIYGRAAEVVAPATPMTAGGTVRAIPGVQPGFVLCVSRLLGYKHLDVLLELARSMPSQRFVVVGAGPHAERLQRAATSNVVWLGTIHDDELRWAYTNASVLVSMSEEDFGLTPLEAAAHGTPSLVPRARGYLDHVVEGTTGLFHDGTLPGAFESLAEVLDRSWDRDPMAAHSASFGADSFAGKMQALVEELR